MEERRKILQEKMYDENGLLEYTIIPNFKLKEDFLSENERKFLIILITIAQKIKEEKNINIQIFSQVAINQIVKINNTRASELYEYIKNKSIDFLLYDRDNGKIISCIELDDYTHEQEERKERDLKINKVFESINLKLIHIKVQNFYNMEEIYKEVF